MNAVATSAGSRARAGLVAELAEVGIEASLDVGSFYPQPVGVLVGLPTLESRGLASWVFVVPVHVVSGDPLNSELAVDRVLALAEQAALALSTANYRPSSWRSSSNAEPLPSLELAVVVSVATQEV